MPKRIPPLPDETHQPRARAAGRGDHPLPAGQQQARNLPQPARPGVDGEERPPGLRAARGEAVMGLQIVADYTVPPPRPCQMTLVCDGEHGLLPQPTALLDCTNGAPRDVAAKA